MFKIIACINKKNAIGKDGDLLYNIKNDLANFKSMTTDNVVIMGRKTFESLPNGKPLPDRINIVLTKNKDWCTDANDNLFIVSSMDEAKMICDTFFPDKEWFIIGGASIYNECIKRNDVKEMRLTLVNDDKEGDSYFPSFSENEWKVYYKSMLQGSGNKSFIFEVLKKA